MLFIGAFLLLAVAFVLWKEYTAYLKRGADELDEFVRFVKCMKEKMECYMEVPAEWIRGFSSDKLEGVGFLEAIRDGSDVDTAYSNVESSLCMCDDAREVLKDLFSHLGNGYLETELGMIKPSLDKLLKIQERLKDEKENKTKAIGAMIAAVTLGIIILIL